MLQELHVHNYAVIDNLRLEFRTGLNLLSGETGSGKSILIDAMGLALAGRASPDLIRTGQERAVVTAVFRADGKPPWGAWLEACGLGNAGERELILRREVQAGGKSRLLVNDQPATLASVKELVPLLVELHGQHEHAALLAREAQLALLDRVAGAERLLEKTAQLFAARRTLEQEMEALATSEQERLRSIDLLKFQVQELEGASLEAGEDARLEEEKRLLANLEKIRVAAAIAYGRLYEDEGSVASRLAVVTRSLEELRSFDAALEPYGDPLAAARATLEDLALYLRDYLGKLGSNPHRLEEVEDRLAFLDRLKRKYGKTIEAMLAYRDDAARRLANLEHADERRGDVQGEVERVAGEYSRVARELSKVRADAARRLEKLLRSELAQVGMEKARFEIRLEPVAEERGGPAGTDVVEFLISPNPGEELRPLTRIASGGELSRVMLGLKTVAARPASVVPAATERRAAPTFIFDEVDVGIGGRVAESVGRRLKSLAGEAQVLCVTHLAQIACFADHHFVVEKFERSGRTVTEVKALESDRDRAQELARMLSGRQITDAVLKHAATMLRQAAANR